MNTMILFEHPVSYAKLKVAFEDVIENFISSSEFDYENQAYWLKKLHRILIGKVITYRNNVDDLDNQMYIEYLLDFGFYGKICLYDGIQTKGCVTLTDRTMINGICIVAPKSFKGDEYNESLYKILIKMGDFIKNSLESDSLICYSVDGDTELLDFLGALSIFYFKIKKLTPNEVSLFKIFAIQINY